MQKTREQIIAEHDGPTAIGSLDGRFDYPSSRGLGVDVVDYQRRNPHPTEHNPLPVKVQVRHIPALIANDLTDAANKGELPSELARHIALLEKNGFADPSTIELLRGYQADLTGHPACDRDQLDTIKAVVLSCGPKGV
jgi:hypothetical protein